MKQYFVSYSYRKIWKFLGISIFGRLGTGCMTYECKNIESMDDIIQLGEDLRSSGFDNPVILNYIEIKE